MSDRLPPPDRRALWRTWFRWVVGLPAVICAGCAVIFGGLALLGGDAMWRTLSDMGTALMYIAGLVVLYPFLVIMWNAELRSGLKARRDWDALSAEAQAAAMQAAKPASRRKRRAAT